MSTKFSGHSVRSHARAKLFLQRKEEQVDSQSIQHLLQGHSILLRAHFYKRVWPA